MYVMLARLCVVWDNSRKISSSLTNLTDSRDGMSSGVARRSLFDAHYCDDRHFDEENGFPRERSSSYSSGDLSMHGRRQCQQDRAGRSLASLAEWGPINSAGGDRLLRLIPSPAGDLSENPSSAGRRTGVSRHPAQAGDVARIPRMTRPSTRLPAPN